MNYLATQYTNNDIIWNGPNISCIKVCTGDTVSVLVYNICKHICSLTETYEDVSLECLISYCGNCDKDKSLKRILELVLKNDCDIKDLITTLDENLEEALSLTFNLNNTCFNGLECSYEQNVFNNCGKLITQDYNKILQYIIDIYCCLDDYINNIYEDTFDYRMDYLNAKEVIDEGDYYTETVLTNCLTSVPVKYSELLKITANKACSIYENLGINYIDITTALSHSDGATNLMGSTTEQWTILKNIKERLEVVEAYTCCLPNCDDIEIGYNYTLNTESTFYTLTFNSLYGNNIPSGFVDNGSSITVTNPDGITYTLPIVLQSNFIFVMPYLPFDPDENLTVVINSKLKKDELYCNNTFNSIITN